MDVIVETDTTYMDRVRSRVSSLPGYPLETLIPNIERTKDVEPLAALFAPERKSDFLEKVRLNGLVLDVGFTGNQPLWDDQYIALYLETDGTAASRDLLAIADEFSRYIASELGLLSGRPLLTDCVVGSASFKFSLGLDRINITNAVAASIIFWAIQCLSQAVVDASKRPQLIDFHLCTAEVMTSSGVDRITFYTDEGIMVSCDKPTVIQTASKIPPPDYSKQDAVPDRIDYRALGVTHVMTATYENVAPPQMRIIAPNSAARQLGASIVSLNPSVAADLIIGKTYEIEGYWRRVTKKKHVLTVVQAKPVEDEQSPGPLDDDLARWMNSLRSLTKPEDGADILLGGAGSDMFTDGVSDDDNDQQDQ